MALGRPGFNRGPRPPFKKKEAEHKINQFIRALEVRITGDNVETGIYSIKDALAKAEEQELDLVEISPNAVPPVCKIVDYNKFIYEQKKKMKETRLYNRIQLSRRMVNHQQTSYFTHSFTFHTHLQGKSALPYLLRQVLVPFRLHFQIHP